MKNLKRTNFKNFSSILITYSNSLLEFRIACSIYRQLKTVITWLIAMFTQYFSMPVGMHLPYNSTAQYSQRICRVSSSRIYNPWLRMGLGGRHLLLLNNYGLEKSTSFAARYFSSTSGKNIIMFNSLYKLEGFKPTINNQSLGWNRFSLLDGFNFISGIHLRRISSFGMLNDIKNPMSLEDGRNPLFLDDGSYKTLSEIKMPGELKWEKLDIGRDNIGTLGVNGGVLDDMYLKDIGDKSGYDVTDVKQRENLEEVLKIGGITEEKANGDRLAEKLKGFNPLLSYSLAFVIYNPREFTFKTIGQHYLVNNTSDSYGLIKDFYRNIESVIIRYNFLASDKIMIKFWPLQIKVKDADFSKSNFNALVIDNISKTITKTKKIPMFRSRFLSSNFIPLSMYFHIYYGVLVSKRGNIFDFLFNNRIIRVEVIDFMNEHIITIYDTNGEFIGRVLDVKYNNGFIRSILNKDEKQDDKRLDSTTFLYIENFKLQNLEYKVNTQFLSPRAKEYIHRDKFITMDVETYREDNQHIPYACGFYDGKNMRNYYLTDFKDSVEMINAMINDVIIAKYAGYRVYLHNFNKFDSGFLFRSIERKCKISNPLPRNTGLLSFTATSYSAETKKRINLKFVDSIALLPFSLAYLAESFKVDTRKDVFPYSFVNASNLLYKGKLPDYKYYEQSTDMLIKYGDMVHWFNKDNQWDMKNETLKYLNKDLLSLHQIITKMDEIIYSSYRVNITNKPTIASLSMMILRSNFMKNIDCIPKTKGDVETAVRNAYFGGRNEVFRPVEFGVYSYDFNSLYPSAMIKDLPVGSPIFSLIKDIDKIFGFVKVKVTSPDNIKIPILPVKLLTKSGEVKLVFPCGTWTHWYFSEEVKLAKRHGYKIEVVESYIFERGKDILSKYVEHMASYKDNSTGAMRNIHKLLLNTPYGRLGMKNIRDNITIATNKEYEEIIQRYKVIDAFRLSSDKVFVKHSKFPFKMACEQSGFDFDSLVMEHVDNDFVDNSTPIAAAIASWSRIIMYPWIVDSAYTDTDSIFIKNKLPSNMIGKGLGKFKLEYGGQIHKAIFVSPKLYYLNTLSGDITKSKGISLDLTKSDFSRLFNGGCININQERWVRDLKDENVKILDQQIKISGDYDKRNKLFSKGKWVDTSPLIINENFEIVPTDLILYENKMVY